MPSKQDHAFLRRVGFGLLFVFLLWLAHAIGYLVHEYAHSFIAWAFHAKANPLALDYGGLNWENVIYLSDIDENVDYDPIFQAGHGFLAALIAAAGVLFGNGLFYILARQFYSKAKARGKRIFALFWFLLCMMCAGNFISYVPNRTFTTHADMATVERGLNISPWWIAIVLGVPFCAAVAHFFVRILPDAMRFFFPDSKLGQVFLLLLTAWVICEFFGASGLHRYGDVSHWIASVWVYIVFPVTIILGWPRRKAAVPA